MSHLRRGSGFLVPSEARDPYHVQDATAKRKIYVCVPELKPVQVARFCSQHLDYFNA
jgi:hypothetical protein